MPRLCLHLFALSILLLLSAGVQAKPFEVPSYLPARAFRLGERYRAKNQLAEAAQAFAAAYALSGRIDALSRLSQTYVQAHRSAEALIILQQRRRLVQEATQQADLDQEMDELRAKVARTRPDWRDWYIEGKVAFEKGFATQAIAAMATVYVLDPSDPMGLANVGQAHRRAKNIEEAMVSYRHFIDVAPTHKFRQEALSNIDTLGPLVIAKYKRPIYENPWFWGGLSAGTLIVATVVVLGATLGRQIPDLPNHIP